MEGGLYIPVPPIFSTSKEHRLFSCKGMIDDIEVDWVLSCGHWSSLQLKQEEIERGKVNIADHLLDILPKEGNVFGLFTYQNGVQTPFDDFIKSCLSIIEKIPEGTLFLGMYNPTHGFRKDLFRSIDEFNSRETPIVSMTRSFFRWVAQKIHSINEKLLWIHVPHSEAGVIARRAIEGLSQEAVGLVKSHLYLYSVGPLLPVAMNYAFRAVNVYAEGDIGMRRYAKEFLNEPTYDIRIIPSSSNFRDRCYYVFDHAFLGNTYQQSLKGQIDELRSKYGFYGVT